MSNKSIGQIFGFEDDELNEEIDPVVTEKDVDDAPTFPEVTDDDVVGDDPTAAIESFFRGFEDGETDSNEIDVKVIIDTKGNDGDGDEDDVTEEGIETEEEDSEDVAATESWNDLFGLEDDEETTTDEGGDTDEEEEVEESDGDSDEEETEEEDSDLSVDLNVNVNVTDSTDEEQSQAIESFFRGFEDDEVSVDAEIVIDGETVAEGETTEDETEESSDDDEDLEQSEEDDEETPDAGEESFFGLFN
jgi:hypothetical protein